MMANDHGDREVNIGKEVEESTSMSAPCRHSKCDMSADTNLAVSMHPLISASQNGHYNVVKLLIENGPEVNLKDNIGYSALMIAIEVRTI